MAYIEAVCISEKKGVVKRELNEVFAKVDWGIVSDAHVGDWHRQVSLLAGESIDSVRAAVPALKHGAFAENIVTRGIDLTILEIGDRLRIGDTVILEITQIGKECHNDGCAIKKLTGDCIMPREGLFCRVIEGGAIKTKDAISLPALSE